MSKKIIKIILTLITILLVIIGVLYIIDMNNIKNNKPIIFSNFGKKYAPPITEDLSNTKNEEIENLPKEDSLYFYAKVIESKQNNIIVEPNEGEEIRKSADKISIGLGEYNDAIYEVGTNVKITYTGYVMETYPAKVDAIKIEVKSAESFEIRFYDKHPPIDTKINKILDKSETNRYNYDIYSYDGSVNILINGEEISLRNALLENKITMDEIIVKANKDLNNKNITGDTYKDGGSIIYNYDNYRIIKFHTLEGNRDIYIGTKDMNIDSIK